MKKIVSAMLAGMLVCGALSAQPIKVVNTFGGDADSTGGSDLFAFENQKDDDGKYKNEFGNKTRVSDRLQIDASSEKFDGRVRVELGTTKLNEKESTVRLRGYGRFKPIEQFQIIAGNDFSTKVAVDASVNLGMKNLFSAGATFQNITGDDLSIGAFAGLNAVEKLTGLATQMMPALQLPTPLPLAKP